METRTHCSSQATVFSPLSAVRLGESVRTHSPCFFISCCVSFMQPLHVKVTHLNRSSSLYITPSPVSFVKYISLATLNPHAACILIAIVWEVCKDTLVGDKIEQTVGEVTGLIWCRHKLSFYIWSINAYSQLLYSALWCTAVLLLEVVCSIICH